MTEIKLTYKGTPYTLGFDRDSVRRMESMGFKMESLGDRPVSLLPQLFAGSFWAHHKKVKQSVIDDIYKACPKKDEIVEALIKAYMEVVDSIMDDPSEADEGNVEWEIQ